jgi:hypothetical protein
MVEGPISPTGRRRRQARRRKYTFLNERTRSPNSWTCHDQAHVGDTGRTDARRYGLHFVHFGGRLIECLWLELAAEKTWFDKLAVVILKPRNLANPYFVI